MLENDCQNDLIISKMLFPYVALLKESYQSVR